MNFHTIPLEYVEVLLDFLYDNSASRVLAKRYTESFITNMIVVADQLFCDRLKDIFQVHLLRRFTMKRTVDWLDVAHTYHCDLLKKAVYDFVCANLREVLEHRYLDNVELEQLAELDERYREMFPETKYRQVVPSPAVTEEEIESFARGVVVDLTRVESLVKTPGKSNGHNGGVGGGIFKEPKSATKTTADYEKEGKQSLLLQVDEQMRLEEAAASPPKNDKNLANLLSEESSRAVKELQEEHKSIWQRVEEKRVEPKRKVTVGSLNANEVLRNEEKMCDNFSNLKLVLIEDRSVRVEEPNDESLSQVNNSISLGDFLSPPPSSSPFAVQMGRLSQKQRKRQSSTRKSESEWTTPPPAAVVESVWNVPVNDLVDSPDLSTGAIRKNRSSGGGQKGKGGSERRTLDFERILVEEKREKEYFDRLKTKPLTLTQLEESAISELMVFYNVDQVFDETIVVTRKVRQKVSQSFSQWARPTVVTEDNKGNGGGGAIGGDGA